MSDVPQFLAGAIEGFYGAPWTPAERAELFTWLEQWRLNTYLYAPKDDLKQRALWRERYSPVEETGLRHAIADGRRRGVRFLYGLSPGLDLRYGEAAELERLQARFAQMIALGCEDFALLFDDIPDAMSAADRAAFGSFAVAQARVANALWRWTRERAPAGRFLFCPTAYCGRMAEARLGGEGYLAILGRELAPEIDVFWTGPEIISRTISVAHMRELRQTLRRKPVLWDNLHANDYDGRRCYVGPYAGRPAELRAEVGGILSNPNCEFALNFVPLRTLAEFVNGAEAWDARAAYRSAMREWLPRFGTVVGRPITEDELVALGDCYYLPEDEGPEAVAVFSAAHAMLAAAPEHEPAVIAEFRARAIPLRECCARLAELKDRALFHALGRRVWELREELDLLLGWARAKSDPARATEPFRSDFHRPGTYRGGLVPRLQQLLELRADGSFVPRPRDSVSQNFDHRSHG